MYSRFGKKILSVALSAALVMGAAAAGQFSVQAAETDTTASGSAVTTETPSPSTPPTSAPVDTSKIKISKKKNTIMAGKKTTLTITGTTSPVTWASQNPAVATVANGVVKGVKKGTAVITASVDGIILNCTITVVAKMTKKDFGKFNAENFVSYCTRKGYNRGWSWVGQWKGGSKKKSTYRKVKIGNTLSTVQKKYGELNVKKCTSKDPFTKMKGLKKNKVKTYADVTYGKYRIRFYFNSKKKVVAIILACNINKIKKKALKKYM